MGKTLAELAKNLDPSLTPEKLAEIATNPSWNDKYGWGCYVPEAMQVAWQLLPLEVQIVAYFVAEHNRKSFSYGWDVL